MGFEAVKYLTQLNQVMTNESLAHKYLADSPLSEQVTTIPLQCNIYPCCYKC